MFLTADMITLMKIFLIVLLLYICFRKPTGIPPGPVFTVPLLGDLPQFAVSKCDTIAILRKFRKKYGKIYSYYMGRQLTIVVNGYSMIYKVAVERGLQFCGRPQNYTNKIIAKGRGIVFATGNTWNHQRQFASKSFLNLGMRNTTYENRILKEVSSFIGTIEKQEDQPFDMKKHIHKSIAKVVFSSIFGRNEHTDSLIGSFIQLLETEARLLSRASILLNCLPVLGYIPRDPFQLRKIQKAFQTFKNIVKEHVVEPARKTSKNDAATFVEMYIEHVKEHESERNHTVFSLDQMYVVLRDILSGVCQAVPVTIRWAILYLVNFPEIQQRLQQHIDEMIPKANMSRLHDKAKLPYIEAFIAEVQRCANILPLGVPRAEINGQDTSIEGYLIPKDAAIVFDFDSIFMDGEIFEHPEMFNPDRFINESGDFVTPKEFVPFSLGRRGCFGAHLAKWIIFSYMVNLVKTFTFLPADDKTLPKISGSNGGIHEPKRYTVRCVRRI